MDRVEKLGGGGVAGHQRGRHVQVAELLTSSAASAGSSSTTSALMPVRSFSGVGVLAAASTPVGSVEFAGDILFMVPVRALRVRRHGLRAGFFSETSHKRDRADRVSEEC